MDVTFFFFPPPSPPPLWYQCSDLFLKLEIMNIQVSYQCIRAERVYFQVFGFFV